MAALFRISPFSSANRIIQKQKAMDRVVASTISPQWIAGIAAFDLGDFEQALQCLDVTSRAGVPDTAKMSFTIAMIHANMQQLDTSVGLDASRHSDWTNQISDYSFPQIAWLARSVAQDPFLAIAWYQKGVFLYAVGRCAEAKADFEKSLEVRSNPGAVPSLAQLNGDY
jgi:tetratricopeptide (TPR) repeat protein